MSNIEQAWVLEPEESYPLIKQAYDAGINFFDTADVYSNGESEKILGEAIKRFGFRRDKIVVATKCFSPVGDTPGELTFGKGQSPEYVNRAGLSRKHIFDAVAASLQRLGLDYIDLYQIHRWDAHTPIEETMEALNDLVRSGKVRYIGASSMSAWQFAKAQAVADKNGWAKFVSMQNLVNLIYREEEREMLPLCADQGVGVIPWSPLARGVLSGKKGTTRSETDMAIKRLFGGVAKTQEEEIVARTVAIAEKRGVTPSQIAIAWLLSKPVITSPIVGINKAEYIGDLIAGTKLKLTAEEIAHLEEPYFPRPLQPF